jgi:DNA processing protein
MKILVFKGTAVSDEVIFWIGFNLVKGIGAVRFRALLNKFGSARTAWEASPNELRDAGLSPKIVESVLEIRSKDVLSQVQKRIEALNIQALTWEDGNYPRLLKEIDQPPPILYVRGDLQAGDDLAVAVVGTRRITTYGRQVTEELTSTLAMGGITVISGLARGVDSIAHQAALNAGGRTIAVLGCGVDIIYPPENRRLAERIMQKGALISDYPPGTPPDGLNFPPRNRIISGLSRAVVIVEAGLTSGALITSGFAADQGREVFAVPGNIFAPLSKGTNRLIRDGARPLLDPREILEALDLTQAVEQRAVRSVLPADATEATLFHLLGSEPIHVDEIRAQSGIPIENVSATLALMELKGMVRMVGGMQYIRVGEPPEEYLL